MLVRRPGGEGLSLLGSLGRKLYRAARLARDLEVLSSGNPIKILKRQANKAVASKLGKLTSFRLGR